MVQNLLVVTPDNNFGELIRQTLEETKLYAVHVVTSGESAVEAVSQSEYSLAFLDADSNTNQAFEIGQRLRQIQSKIQFILISESGPHAELDALQPVGYLAKPFYFPDLLGMLDQHFTGQMREVAENEEIAPAPKSDDLENQKQGDLTPWAKDVDKAAQHLTRLTLESSAQAALITNNNKLWAYAGQLPQSAAREMADAVLHYWDDREKSDLVRFIRLKSTNVEHMLYATKLIDNMLLALIFDAETSFTTIRTQAGRLVHSLSSSSSLSNLNMIENPDWEAQPVTISDILSEVPSPNPTTGELSTESIDPLTDQQEDQVSADKTNGKLEHEVDAGKTISTKGVTKKVQSVSSELLENSAATRPTSVPRDELRQIKLEPVSASRYHLSYACLLIPRFTKHRITASIKRVLSIEVTNTCIAFGWRLEYLSMHEEYMQWIVNVPPPTSPAYLIKTIRSETSSILFEVFPSLKKENSSGDFWAPGYLIMGGSQMPPDQLIWDFIQQTRQRQGLSKPLTSN